MCLRNIFIHSLSPSHPSAPTNRSQTAEVNSRTLERKKTITVGQRRDWNRGPDPATQPEGKERWFW